MRLSVLTVMSLFVLLLFGGVATSSVAESGKNIAPEEAEKMAIEHLQKGIMYDDQGEFAKAIAEYNKTLEYYPGAENALYNLGFLHMKMDNMSDAISTFDRLVKLSPDYYEAFNLLGMAYNEIGKGKEAAEAWKTSLSLQADQPKIRSSYDKLTAVLIAGRK